MAIKKKKITPRQKMINLMYVVLMAMLALNVSSDVLDAFNMVDDSLTRSTINSDALNKNIYSALDAELRKDPAKAKEIHNKANNISVLADALYNFIDTLKTEIAIESDGDDADVHNLSNRDNLEAANQIMLSPTRGKGDALKASIDRYREKILEVVVNPTQRKLIADNLTTDVPSNTRGVGKGWKEYLFENTPACAAITILSKLQSDVRYSETQVLHELINNSDLDIDVGTGRALHVNAIDAYVIPSATTVVRGSKFKARVVVGSIDTTQHPSIYVGNSLLKATDGMYETLCSSTGTHKFSGYILAVNGDGKVVRKEFSQEYTVVEPAATVSATLMNVLYAGYQNPISVSVPGVPVNQVNLSMTRGTLSRNGDGQYTAVPAKVGEDVIFTVTANQEGHATTVGTFPFKVRKLPDPAAYIEYKDAQGNPVRYKGGGKAISKKALLSATGISAAIDDGLLDIPFKVTGFTIYFTTRLGEFVPRAAQGNTFTDQQMALMRQLTKGKHFFISEIQVVGPDGIKRTLDAAMDGRVN
ncbi:MAG: gliding motility protein GldM [Prevotellaceae bacterium]|nr:gliding motility protein GldM [Candidatus Colivivens equi]